MTAVLVGAWLAATGSAAFGHEQEGPNVLILQSLDAHTSPYNVPTLAFRQRLQAHYEAPVSFVDLDLDARWGSRSDREPYQAQLLQNRLDSQPPDLVVGVGPSAIDFWRRYRDQFPVQVPTILMAREGMVTEDMLKPGDVGIVSEFSFTHVVDEILALLPETRRVVVVFGASQLERDLTAAAREDLARFGDRIEFNFTSDLRIGEIESLLANLPKRSAVLFGILTIDAGGLILPGNTGLERTVAASNGPVFGVFEHELGDGIVGGRLISTTRMGELAAEEAYRVLLNPDSEPRLRIVPLGRPAYDWRALQAWNIDVQRLAAGSAVLFRPATLWSEYGAWVLLAGILVGAQTLLIAALLIARRRRRIAELTGARLSSQLISAHEDERWRMARELHDDLSQRLAGLAIDASFLSRGPETAGYREALDHLQPELMRISKDVHDMSYRLHPSLVGDLGLSTALRTEVDRVGRRAGRRIETRIEDVDADLPRDVALNLYRIAQQSLANALRHSQADNISVSFRRDGGTVLLEVGDDGKGFNVRDPRYAAGLGISSMRERARLAGGTLDLQSTPGRGTSVTVKVPCGNPRK